jgi:mono/diheme cytochrome c family protein
MGRKTGVLLVALFALVGLAATVAALGFARGGVGARTPPSRLETRLARAARHVLIPRAARAAPNPVRATPEILADGRAHFADHCAVCHGNDGRGETDFGRGLSPRVPDLAAPATQELSDGELFYIIENGVRLTGMPAFGGGRDEGEGGHEGQEESWALVHFIRHLPTITPEEVAEMEDWNPKSRKELEAQQEIERFLAGGEPSPPPHRHDHDH